MAVASLLSIDAFARAASIPESEDCFLPRSRLESRLGFAAWNKERPPWNERFSWRGLARCWTYRHHPITESRQISANQIEGRLLKRQLADLIKTVRKGAWGLLYDKREAPIVTTLFAVRQHDRVALASSMSHDESNAIPGPRKPANPSFRSGVTIMWWSFHARRHPRWSRNFPACLMNRRLQRLMRCSERKHLFEGVRSVGSRARTYPASRAPLPQTTSWPGRP